MTDTDARIQAKFRFHGRDRNLPWYPRKGTRVHLAQFFGEIGFNEGVEVGTCRGQYAECLLNGNKNLHLTCVDPWEAYQGTSQQRADGVLSLAKARLAGRNVTLLRKRSLDAVGDFRNESLDFVYIDGNHWFDWVVRDIIVWVDKVKKGGIIALHDYDATDVAMAVNAYTHCHDIRPWYITREENPTAFWVNR